jgi:dipeptidyl aminopeptidase/acylaminoacyl peptidase
VTVALCLAWPAGAAADAFNGRIAFTSFRADPPPGLKRSGDIFSMNPDGSGLRRLTTNPALDRQPDWSPDGRDIAYTIRKPGSEINYEVARMTAAGTEHRQLTRSAPGQASSQPSWLPRGRGFLFRRSGPGLVASIWQMGPLGENPRLRYAPEHPPLYPSWSVAQRRVLFTSILSPTGDTDRGIFTENVDGTGLTALFEVPGAFDSAPAWSPDGTRIAFESNADVAGGNPEHDMEVWTMNADGSSPTQLTHNAAHDEGPAWSPDATLLAYTSGPDNEHGDIHVMTAGGRHLRRLTSYDGLDESPDWQAIPAPPTDRHCGDAATARGVQDVRARGRGVTCGQALSLAALWATAGRPARVRRFRARVDDYGGTRRVVLTRGAGERRRLVAFLLQE